MREQSRIVHSAKFLGFEKAQEKGCVLFLEWMADVSAAGTVKHVTSQSCFNFMGYLQNLHGTRVRFLPPAFVSL